MKTVSLKLADPILQDIDAFLEEHYFSTRTEFIREAIRDKIQVLENKRFEQEMRKFFRENKSEMAQKQFLEAHGDVFKELEQRFGQ
jgi:metal-responsive CopG/Arc/MetJ family transcriptional regulator